MAYGHSSGLPPSEAPVTIAEKRKLFSPPIFFMHDHSRNDDRGVCCILYRCYRCSLLGCVQYRLKGFMWDPQRVWDQAEEGGEGGLHSHGVGVVEGRIGRNNRLDCIQCDVSKGKAGRETFLLKMGYCKCIARCMLQVHTMSLFHLSSNK